MEPSKPTSGWTDERRIQHAVLEATIDEEEHNILRTEGTLEYFTHCRDWLDAERQIRDLRWIADGGMDPDSDRSYCNLLERTFERIERRERRANLQHAVSLFMRRVGNCREGRTVFVKLLVEVVLKVERTKSRSFEQRMRRKHEVFIGQSREMIFSPVARRSLSVEDVEPMYIVPSAIKEMGMRLLFGPDVIKGELHSAMNGLWCPRGLEKSFNNFGFVFVPATTNNKKGEEPCDWKILVLRGGGVCKCNGEITVPQSYLHERTLRFENDVRPRARYFYFRYLMAMTYLSQEMRKPKKDPFDGYPIGADKKSNETFKLGLGVTHFFPQGFPEEFWNRKFAGEPFTMTVAELAEAWVPRGEYMRQFVLKAIVEQIPELTGKEKNRILLNSLKNDTPKSGVPGISASRVKMEEAAELVDATDNMDLESNFGD